MVKDDRVNVLLVDDQPGKLLSYRVMLEELDENLHAASSATEALAFLLKTDVAVILVDVCMPDLDGFELAKMIREHPRFQKTAMIFISAVHMSESDFLRGYEVGAVDYLSVPVVPELLRAKVRIFAELFRKTRQLRQLNEELESRVQHRTEELAASTERLRASEQARGLALAAGNMGSWACDFGAEQWFWDEGQSRILGLHHESFQPSMEKFEKCIYPDDLMAFRKAIAGLAPQNPSFELELRAVRPGGEIRWCRVVGAGVWDEAGRLARLSGVTTDITERKEAENKQLMLAREVDHRAKNALAVVQAIVRLARRDSIENYIEAVDGRISALAKTHELLSRARWLGADVLRLVLEEMAPYQGGPRVTAIGPSVMVAPNDAQTLALALHELATNAAKYGALSAEGGRVDISWSLFEKKLALTWKESGGPPVEKPRSQGFGTKIMMAGFSDARRSKVSFDWNPAGLCCVLELRMAAAEDQPENPRPAPVEKKPAATRRLLVVEDEPLIGVLMEDMLHDIGFEDVELCHSLEDGMAAIRRQDFVGAILDMNLNGAPVYPLADQLIAKGVPLIFVTGYSREMVDKRFADIPLLEKPVDGEKLASALKGFFKAPRNAPDVRLRVV